jgi:RNA polymerase sigma-70 factor (ECF subfamily)
VSNPTSDNLDTLYRQHSAQMLAYLYCLTQDLDAAQELWHETFIEAMQLWQTRRPDSVSAWFKRIAKNKFIDRYRHQKISAEKTTLITALLTEETQDDTMEATDFGDEQLKLIFTCCHPALDFDKQVALTLNIISGLSTDQVAKALLLQTATPEQRLTRAKRKIKQVAIPLVIPQKNHLA